MRPILVTEPTRGDYVHAVVKGGLSAIPIDGRAASELFAP